MLIQYPHIEDVKARIMPHLLPEDHIRVQVLDSDVGLLHVHINQVWSASDMWIRADMRMTAWQYEGPAMTAEIPVPVTNWVHWSLWVDLTAPAPT